jgi:hypothetical protein
MIVYHFPFKTGNDSLSLSIFGFETDKVVILNKIYNFVINNFSFDEIV